MKLLTRVKVIMNPPYNGSLHLKILNNVISCLKDAEIVNLSPIRWLQDPSAEYKKSSDYNKFTKIRERIADLDVMEAIDAQSTFRAAFWNDLGIYYLTEKGGYNIKSYRESMLDAAMKKVIENICKPVYANKTIPAVTDLFDKNNDFPYWIRCPRTHGHIGNKDEFDLVAPDIKWSLNVIDKENKCVYFRTEDEARNFYSTLQSPLYKFIKKIGFYSTANYFTGMPYLGDYTHPWNDTDLYRYFDLSKDEIDIIESTINEVKSA